MSATVPVIEGTRLLRRIAEHVAAIGRVERDAEAQMAEIHEWRASEVRQHEHEIATLQARLQPLVDVEMARNPLERKSVRFPSGTAGYRAPAPRAVIVDAEAFVAWAQRNRPEWVRTKTEPALTAITADAVDPKTTPAGPLRIRGETAGEITEVPGVRVERGDRIFYAKPGAVT